MITREINSVANELTNLVIDKIYHIAKNRQENTIDLEFTFHNEYYSNMEIDFPADDEEFDCIDEYLDNMDIVVNYEYTDNEDGLKYEEQTTLGDLDLSILIEIYNTIKD